MEWSPHTPHLFLSRHRNVMSSAPSECPQLRMRNVRLQGEQLRSIKTSQFNIFIQKHEVWRARFQLWNGPWLTRSPSQASSLKLACTIWRRPLKSRWVAVCTPHQSAGLGMAMKARSIRCDGAASPCPCPEETASGGKLQRFSSRTKWLWQQLFSRLTGSVF